MKNDKIDKTIVPVILGPTAVGKTEFALRAAEEAGYELISCDSRQIYRGMDIGTAKPTAGERARVRHHLIDILDPSERYSAVEFALAASRVIRECRDGGRRALICGGAGLYYHVLTTGFEGRHAVDDMDFRPIILARPRDELYGRINERVDVMIRSGLLEEFAALRRAGYEKTSPGMNCVGYRELFAVERGETGLDRAVELIKQNTRHYAKRQLTWFRNKVADVPVIDVSDTEKNDGFLREFLTSGGLSPDVLQ